jgi:DNA-binding HxlR family transcriptional regulator
MAVRQAADVVCDRWALSLIHAASGGECRFAGLAQRTGMASRLVTSRLKLLEIQGVLVRVPYSERPPRYEYRLTEMGRQMSAIFDQMTRWEKNLGSATFTPLVCAACQRSASARDIGLDTSEALMRQLPRKQTARRRSTLAPGAGRVIHPLSRSFEIFGDKWGIEILICVFFRAGRFIDFRDLTGIAPNILSDRLNRLTGAGLLDRRRDRGRYRLTEAGIDLYGVLVVIQDWADAWLPDRYRSPVRLLHNECGQVFHCAPMT